MSNNSQSERDATQYMNVYLHMSVCVSVCAYEVHLLLARTSAKWYRAMRLWITNYVGIMKARAKQLQMPARQQLPAACCLPLCGALLPILIAPNPSTDKPTECAQCASTVQSQQPFQLYLTSRVALPTIEPNQRRNESQSIDWIVCGVNRIKSN